MVAPAAMREAVAHLQASLGMSERRACRVVGADRKSVRYRSTRPDDGDLRERLRALAAERRRFGYRRLHILLRRDGVLVNRKKTQRLYTEEGLTVRKRRARRRAVGARAAPPVLAPHNGGEGWVGLMEIDSAHPALYSVVDAGGQSLFIDPQGKGNPHLTDQTMMHESNELKKIEMKPEDVRAGAVSTQVIDYVPAGP